MVVITRTTTTGQNDPYTHACTERERDREREMETDRQTDRDTHARRERGGETDRQTERQKETLTDRIHASIKYLLRVKNSVVRSSFDLMSRIGTLVSVNHDALGSTRNTLRSIFGSTAWRYIIASGVTDGLTHTNSVYVLCTILRRAVH